MMSAGSGGDAVWHRVDNIDPEFSFELPCAPEAIDFRDEGVPGLGGTREAICDFGGTRFLVSVTSFPEDQKKPAFDGLKAALASQGSDPVEQVTLGTNGHRYIADRSGGEGMFGQRALIEIDGRKVALVLAGGEEAQRTMIDRFFASLKVGGA